MSAEKDIYKMDLHETIGLPFGYVTRVPGGWIYGEYNPVGGVIECAVFVPFNNEFQKKATENKKSEYEIVELDGKKYERVPAKLDSCAGVDGTRCSRIEVCPPFMPDPPCDGYILREIKEKEEKS